MKRDIGRKQLVFSYTKCTRQPQLEFGTEKLLLEWRGYPTVQKFEDMFWRTRFDRTDERDGTDRVASHGKNGMIYTVQRCYRRSPIVSTFDQPVDACCGRPT